MLIDSHCHLNFPEFADCMDEIRAAMQAAGVDEAICISTTLEEFPAVQALADIHANFWATVGVHPDNEGVEEPSVDDLISRSAAPKVIAIGETGLDYYRLNGRTHADMAWQRQRFANHIHAAKHTQLPLVVHTREASKDTLAMIRSEGAGQVGGVFHCFTETKEVARAALDLGFYISFSGILTFKNANELREVADFVPLDRCLVETDSPYLAPTPYRGKTNQPAYVAQVAACLADIKKINLEILANETTQNARSLFKKMQSITIT